MIFLVWTASKTHSKPFHIGTKLHVRNKKVRVMDEDDAHAHAPGFTSQRALSRESFEVSGSVLRFCFKTSSLSVFKQRCRHFTSSVSSRQVSTTRNLENPTVDHDRLKRLNEDSLTLKLNKLGRQRR